LKIGVNTRLLLPSRLEGIGRFAYEVLVRMVKKHPEHEFIFFFDRKFDSQFVFAENIKPVVLYPQARHPILYKIWFDYSISNALKKHKIDVFFSPDGYLSKRTKVPQVPVIHDLNFEHYPEDLPAKDLKYYKTNFPVFAKIAKHILTVSEYSKQDISKQYGIEHEKITVAFNGVSDKFKSSLDKAVLRSKYKSETGYFVYVGALHKRKNISRMLQAYDQFIEETGSEKKLVIIGTKLFKSPEIEHVFSALKHQKAILFTGRLSDADLVETLASSDGLIYVSYFEGFGIPVIEAFKCGVPVLTSNVTSLPEVGGNVAFYCNPFDVDSIVNGIKLLDQSKVSSQDLIAQADQFSWDKTAEIVWNVLEASFK